MIVQTPAGKINTNPIPHPFPARFPGDCGACGGVIERGHMIVQTPYRWYRYRIMTKYVHHYCMGQVEDFVSRKPGHAGPIPLPHKP